MDTGVKAIIVAVLLKLTLHGGKGSVKNKEELKIMTDWGKCYKGNKQGIVRGLFPFSLRNSLPF